MPRTYCDYSSVALLDLRMRHVGTQVWAIRFHHIDLVLEGVKRRAEVDTVLRQPTGREAEEDERVVVALLRAQGQKESRVGRKLLEG